MNAVAELRRRGAHALATGDPETAARLAADVIHAHHHAAALAGAGWPEALAIEYGCAAAADCGPRDLPAHHPRHGGTPVTWTRSPDTDDTAALSAAVATARADVEATRAMVARGEEGHAALDAAEYRMHCSLRDLDRLRERRDVNPGERS